MSNDNYRDLVAESCEFKKVVGERVLMYSFVNDRFMPPDDPLGRSGPTLENFLRIQPKYDHRKLRLTHIFNSLFVASTEKEILHRHVHMARNVRTAISVNFIIPNVVRGHINR